jgi:hypothetical protein
VTAIDDYKAMLKDQVGPALRGAGFKGSAGNWRLAADNGDLVIVEAQSSTMTTKDRVLFTINLAAVPAPWVAFKHDGYDLPKILHAYHGVLGERLHALRGGVSRGGEGWWEVTDALSAAVCGTDINQQLVTNAFPVMRRLLDRRQLIAALKTGAMGIPGSRGRAPINYYALAILLAEDGPSADLEAALAAVAADRRPVIHAHNERVLAWARSRAAAH